MDITEEGLSEALNGAHRGDPQSIMTVQSAVISQAARDLDLSNDHIVGFVQLLTLLKATSGKQGVDALVRAILEIVVHAFSWPELSGRQLEAVPETVAVEAGQALLDRLFVASDNAYRQANFSSKDNMGLVTMVSTGNSGGSTSRGSARAGTTSSAKGKGTRAQAAAGPVAGRRAIKWDEITGVRAILTWLAATWPAARKAILGSCIDTLANIGKKPGELEPGHAHAIRVQLQLLLSAAKGEQARLATGADVHTTLSLLSDERSARRLLDILGPLRHMKGMVTDTGSVLGVYHEALVGLVSTAVGRYPSLLPQLLHGILESWQIAAIGTSAAAILLLHEAQTLLFNALSKGALTAASLSASSVGGAAAGGTGAGAGDAPSSTVGPSGPSAAATGEPLQRILSQLLPILSTCVSSDNSRLAQMGLGFIKHGPFVDCLAALPPNDGRLQHLLNSMLRGGRKHWNDTVNKHTAAALQTLEAACPQAVELAASAMFGAAGTGTLARAADADTATTPPSQEGMTTGRLPRAPPTSVHVHATHSSGPVRALPPGSAVSAELSSTLTAGSFQMGLQPASGAAVGSPAVVKQPPVTITGVAPWAKAAGGQPPVTITGVAPWAKGAGGQPPATVTGVAPWAKPQQAVPTAPRGAGIAGRLPLSVDGQGPELPSSSHSATGHTPGTPLDAVHAYITSLLPPPVSTDLSAGQLTVDGRGGSDPNLPHWLSCEPVYLPTLAFHDLVFGRELGSGAFASVRYAKAVQRGRPDSTWPEYAVKVIDAATIQEMSYEHSARREIAVLSVLTHPNTARMVSSFRWRDGLYLVLEYGKQGDLHDTLTRLGSLDEESARWVCGEILAALLAIHELGLVYADCKPENVVLVEDLSGGTHVKLTDFAACRPVNDAGTALVRSAKGALERLRDGSWRPGVDGPSRADVSGPPTAASGAVPSHDAQATPSPSPSPSSSAGDNSGAEAEDERVEGTAEYLPPEALSGHARPCAAWDCYAFGVTLYQCLTGRLPDVGLIWPAAVGNDQDAQGQGKAKHGVRFDASAAGRKDVSSGKGGRLEDSGGFPADFPETAGDLVRQLLHPDPSQRLGADGVQSVSGAMGLAAVAEHPWFKPLGGLHGLQALHAKDAPRLAQGAVEPSADPAWSRRHNSSIWAPLPKAYSISNDNVAAGAASASGIPSSGPGRGHGTRTAADFTLQELVALEVLPPL